jgi:hypothetical protein
MDREGPQDRASPAPKGGQPLGYMVRLAAARPAPKAKSHIVWSRNGKASPLPVSFTVRLCATTSAS